MQKKARTVWERVREVLAERGLPANQKYFAERMLHIKQPSISDWNKVGGYPKMDNAVKAAQLLGVSLEWLMTERGPKYVLPKNEPEADALHRIWHELDGIGRSRLLAHAVILATPVPVQPPSPAPPVGLVRQR